MALAGVPVGNGLWDDGAGMSWPPVAAGSARDAGALTSSHRAHLPRRRAVLAGEFAAAAAMIDEADAISQATGNAPLRYTSLVLAAWRGEEARRWS